MQQSSILFGLLTKTKVDGKKKHKHENEAKRVVRSQDHSKNVDRTLNSTHTCHLCKKSFPVRHKLKKHMLTHSTQRPFKCDICHSKFKYRFNMIIHKNQQHNDERVPLYNCKFCSFSTKDKAYMSKHCTRKHSEVYNFTCEQCGRKFKILEDLKHHTVTHELGQFICETCGASYSNKSSLSFHIYRKHKPPVNSVECHVCRRKLRGRTNLERHLKLHSQEYVCQECGAKSKTKNNLKKHMKVHTGEKSFRCPSCDRAFTSQSTQRMHTLTHTGERPYVCDVCGQSFTQRSPMVKHRRTQHPEVEGPPPPISVKAYLKK